MSMAQSMAVIFGANVGTTITGLMIALDVGALAPVVAFAGVFLMVFVNQARLRHIGQILAGLGILFIGMDTMSAAMAPLREFPAFLRLMSTLSNPLLGILFGALFTALIQSSAASVGILQALSLTGGITYGMALPIIMGQNIGTCVTALLSSIGVNRNARRVSVIHISFNLIGTAVCLAAFYGSDLIFHYAFMDLSIGPAGIAMVHSIFNIATTVLLLPFTKQLEKLAYLVVREDQGEKEKFAFIDERLLATPSVAIAECANKTVDMAQLAETTILRASPSGKYDEKTAQEVIQNEDRLDLYEDQLGTMLVHLSGRALSDEDSRNISKQLHTIGDFERIGDHAVNLLKTAEEIHEKAIKFSAPASEELAVLLGALKEILALTTRAYAQGDLEMAARVEPLEQVIDGLVSDIKSNHITRLQKGHCTIEIGFVLADLLTNCERVSDHCSNIAVAQIETALNAYQAHEYLNALKSGGNALFRSAFDGYLARFSVKKEQA